VVAGRILFPVRKSSRRGSPSPRELTLWRCRLRRRLVSAVDFLDAQNRQLLAMAVFSPIIFAALLFKNDDLGAARLLNDPGSYRSIGQGWTADSAYVAIANGQDLLESDIRTHLTRNALHHDLVTRTNAILLPTR